MSTDSSEAPPDETAKRGWDETVLVWNATVARIPAPAVHPDAAEDVADADDGELGPNRARV